MNRNDTAAGIKASLSLIRRDLKAVAPAFIPVALYLMLTLVFFHRICPMVLLTGLPCPACGMTRAFFYVITFRWTLAASYNIMIFPWILLILFLIIRRYILFKRSVLSEILLCVLCIATIVYYIYRLIYEYPSGEVMTYCENNLLAFLLRSIK